MSVFQVFILFFSFPLSWFDSIKESTCLNPLKLQFPEPRPSRLCPPPEDTLTPPLGDLRRLTLGSILVQSRLSSSAVCSTISWYSFMEMMSWLSGANQRTPFNTWSLRGVSGALCLVSLPDRSPVAADAPKKYPVGRRTPPMSMHSFHSFLSSTSTMIWRGRRSINTIHKQFGIIITKNKIYIFKSRWTLLSWIDYWTSQQPYGQPSFGVADGEVGVVISVPDLRRAAPQLRRAAVFAVVVRHRAVVDHSRDVREGALEAEQKAEMKRRSVTLKQTEN